MNFAQGSGGTDLDLRDVALNDGTINANTISIDQLIDGHIDVNGGTSTEPENQALIPEACILKQNYPNPFNPVTEIPFEIIDEGQASLTVYNLKGEQIRTIFKRILEPGKHTYVWDGKNDFGEKVGSGMYVYVLQSGSVKLMKKMIFMK